MGCDICGAGAYISVSTTDKCIIPFSAIRHFTLCNTKYTVWLHTLNSRMQKKNAQNHSDKHTHTHSMHRRTVGHVCNKDTGNVHMALEEICASENKYKH